MSRDLDNSLKNEIVKPRLEPIFLSEFFFDTQPIRLWNGLGTLTIGDDTYTGSGTLLSVTEVSESQSVQADGLNFVINGMPDNIVVLALDENYSGRTCTLKFSCLDENKQIIGEPYQLFSGLMDVMQIEDGAETSKITLSAENRLIELKKEKVSRYTPEDQKRRYPDDTGLDFVPSLQDKELVWGRASPK